MNIKKQEDRDCPSCGDHHRGWHRLARKGTDWHEERTAPVAHRPVILMVQAGELKPVITRCWSARP
jgi:hypothetical protein